MSVILVAGREWEDGDPMPGAVDTWRKLLFKHYWEVKVGYSESFEEGGEYGPTAQKAGEKKPDSHIKLVWIDAHNDDHFVTITYQYTNDSDKATCVYRSWDKRIEKLSDAELKQRINDAATHD